MATVSADVAKDGLILYLDASSQIKEGGTGSTNTTWKNLAGQPDTIAGDGALRNFGFDNSSGWVGSGHPKDPFALRFDGQKSYVIGPGNLEIPEITLEAWARVEGYTLRGATLIGNDFGKGGVCLLINTAAESPILVHQVTFSPVGAETPAGQWQQVVVTLKDGTASAYVNGRFSCSQSAPRELQKDHDPYWQLGAARHVDKDYVEADGLIGSLAIVRVYSRALASDEVLANFNADKGQFAINEALLNLEPVSSMPIASTPGLKAPPARCMKWDYYYNPVKVTSTIQNIQSAFDGYPSNVKHPVPYVSATGGAPTPDKPVEIMVNYRRPIVVAKYVHYYNRFRTPCAWKDVEIYSGADPANWTLLQSFTDLPAEYPQILGIDKPASSKLYKIVVKSLHPGAPRVDTYEIETYYGATVGNVSCSPAVQSETCRLSVTVASPDVTLSGATLKLIAPQGTLAPVAEVKVPVIGKGSISVVSFDITPLQCGPTPVAIELYAGKFLIDKRTYTVCAAPKLAFGELAPAGVVLAKTGDMVSVKGKITNTGLKSASGVKANWLGKSVSLGSIAAGKSAGFEIKARVKPGYAEGRLTASADGLAKTVIRRGVICAGPDEFTVNAGTRSSWKRDLDAVQASFAVGAKSDVSAKLELYVSNAPCALVPVGNNTLAARVPSGVFVARVEPSAAGDTTLQCSVVPDDPNPVKAPWLDAELRLGVENPKVMFRPHIDWYTVEHGPNWPHLANGHNSATRMLCIQTSDATLSIVPDTDNITWGFTKDNRMTISLQIPMAPYDQLKQGIWRPITEAPQSFTLTLPARKGDWWDAYRYVVTKLFHFEQPRQWAMPITQMQMLTTRELMSYQAWSERWQNVRVYSNDQVFWPFYATAYTLPAIYQWYLATDDATAKIKAEKVVDWLLSVEHKDAPMDGAWFTAYWAEGDPLKMVGTDFIHNRWLIPHGTGAAVKTLLWYWNASGRKDDRVFAAARRGCDWLLRTMGEDGGWPYAFDLDGSRITDQCGAGQIWCTWALWRMYQYTGETKYRDAALKSKDFFKKQFMDVHRYIGYWEDTVGISKQNNKQIGSWECYEPAIATLVFAEMGDKGLSIEAAKDVATYSWTRVISTRQYETGYGQTTEQSLCGPSQAQSPMIGVGFHQVYELTGDPLWSDLSGAVKAINFGADPDQEYGMVATSGWCQPLTGVYGPPYENVRPPITPNMSKGDYGRQLWTGWCTDQFAWLALNWLIREGNVRAPRYFKIDPDTLRGTVLGASGRIKMPEEKCDVNGIDHYDINWVGYSNDLKYALLVMNHKEKITVAIRPHEAHLDVYTRAPKILIGNGRTYKPTPVVKKGVQYFVDIPAKGNAILVWDRIK